MTHYNMLKKMTSTRTLCTAALVLLCTMRLFAQQQEEMVTQEDTRHWFSLQGQARAYDDSIAIRWMPDDYMPWRFLNGAGYIIDRITFADDSIYIDSLTTVRPMNRYVMEKTFAPTDTLAGAAMQLIYGETTKLNNTAATPGSMGSIMEVYEEQQNVFGFAAYVADMRFDLAKAMGLAFVDYDVKPGTVYQYIVRPNISDDVIAVHGAVLDVTNHRFEPKPCTLELTDSVQNVDCIYLEWPYSTYTAFDIERRSEGSDEWVQVNEHPYLSMNFDFSIEQPISRYFDDGLLPGVYYYRLRAYDSFGDRSAPGPEHRVFLPDLLPPTAPVVSRITIDRSDSVQIRALIEFHKDTIEDDLIGYIPFYQYAPEAEENTTTGGTANPLAGQWIPLVTDSLLAVTDTAVWVDVTGLPTGMVTVAAVDTAINITHAMPMPIRIEDLVPPLPPSNLRSACSPDGQVTLVWTPSPSSDVHFYEVFTANDTTHAFMLGANQQILVDTIYRDTISLTVATPYKYYKVRAIDWSGNNSEFSAIHRRSRPNFTPPSVCFVDTTWVTDSLIHIRWVKSPEPDVETYRVFRRLTDDTQWKLIRTWQADKFADTHFIDMEDSPAYEQERRYYYAIESINSTGVSSGLSFQSCFLFRGPTLFDIPLKLEGTYRSDDKQAVLGWTVGKIPVVAPYHFVIYRRLEGEDFFRPYRSVGFNESSYRDNRVRPGDKTAYQIELLYEDGRRSRRSNIVEISAPKGE